MRTRYIHGEAGRANQSEFLTVEDQNLRELMSLQKQLPFKTLPVEILFNPTNQQLISWGCIVLPQVE